MRKVLANLFYGLGMLVGALTFLATLLPGPPIPVAGLLVPAPVVFLFVAVLLVVLGITVGPGRRRSRPPETRRAARPTAERAARPIAQHAAPPIAQRAAGPIEIGHYVNARMIGTQEWRKGVVMTIEPDHLVLQGRHDRYDCDRTLASRIPHARWTESDHGFVQAVREVLDSSDRPLPP